MKTKELREKRAKIVPDIRALADKYTNDEAAAWAPEDQESWDRMNAEYDSLSRQIEVSERAESLDAELGKRDNDLPGDNFNSRQTRDDNAAKPLTDEERALAFQAWTLRQNAKPLRDEHWAAAKRVGIDPNVSELNLRIAGGENFGAPIWQSRGGVTGSRFIERRTQSTAQDTIGGFLVATDNTFMSTLERTLLAYNGPRQVARIVRTATGGDLPFPTVNDTSNTGRLLAENAAITNTAITFGQIVLQAYKYSSDSVLVSSELMQDSAINLAVEVASMLGERIGRITAADFTTGSGAAKPYGVVSRSAAGKTAASATAIAADELKDLVHSVDPAYRMSGSCGFMMHDNILLVLRKLKDGEGRYIWDNGMQAGEPDRLLGYPVAINQNMQSSVATATKTVLFGDFNKFVIRDVADIRLHRLEELYRANDQTGFIAFMRCDSNLLNTGAVKHLVQA